MSILPYLLYSERLVGKSHPTLTDTTNRALREYLRNAGVDPDSVNISVPSFSSTVNAGSNAFTGTKEARITAAVALAVSLGWLYVYVPIKAWDGVLMLPYTASLVTFNSGVTMIRENGNPSVFDVMAYGAKGDGIQDDTASFNAAILGCLGTADPTTTTRFANGPIYMPGSHAAGNTQAVYKLTSEILIRSAQGLKFYGDGVNSTQLYFAATLTNGLNLDGVAHSLFEEFSIRVAPTFTLTNVINCHWGTGTNRNPTGMVFRHVQVGIGTSPGDGSVQYVNGFAIGTDNSNAVDGFTFERCEPLGGWSAGNVTYYQNGFLFGNGVAANNLDHNFYNCEVQGCRYGYQFAGSNGLIYGGQNENCGTDFLVNPLAGEILISGMRVEGSTKFFSMPVGSGGVSGVTIENIMFAGNALTLAQTYPIIESLWSGSFKISNFNIYNVSNAAAVCTVNFQPNSATTVMVDGYSASNSQTVATSFTAGSGYVMFVIRGFSSKNAGNTVIAYTPWQVYNPYGPDTNNLPAMTANHGLALGMLQPTEAVLVSGVDVRAGNTVRVTLTAARLVGAPLNPTTGQSLTFTLIQGGAGAFAVTWNAVFKKIWSDAGNATGTRSSITFIYDGTNWNQANGQALYV